MKDAQERLRITSLFAYGLTPRHVGVEFVGLGVLRSFAITECCVEATFTDLTLTLDRRERLAYYRDTWPKVGECR
ncbi:hypothetical protein [Microbacterium sp. NPDC058389]|uniref:hypothetical protein n=1 Tax=Microbacterium sp. NPDC058389 TaxID=3346475 RepID=UPI00365AD58D